MPRKVGRPKSPKASLKGPRIGIRITKEEKRILRELVSELKKRIPYVNQSIVYRELLGLTYTGLITDEDRRQLRKRIEKEHVQPWIQPPDESPYQHRGRNPANRSILGYKPDDQSEEEEPLAKKYG